MVGFPPVKNTKGEMQVSGRCEPEHFLLKVESFSEFKFEKYESDEFEAGGYRWRLIVYPNGDKERNGSNHISLYLSISDTQNLPSGWEVEADFSLFVYNSLIREYQPYKLAHKTWFNWLETESGFAQLIPLDEFKEASNGYLFGDACAFGAEVYVTGYRTTKRQTLTMKNTNARAFSSKSGVFFRVRKWKNMNRMTLMPEATIEKQVSRRREPEHFLLKVESFSKSKLEKYESDEFEAGGYKWRLILYPNGDKERNGRDHISLYLSICDTQNLPLGWEVDADFSLFVYNSLSQMYQSYKLADKSRFNWLKKDSGFSQLMPVDEFKETSNGYLFGDACVFGAEVYVTRFSAAKRQTLSMIKKNDTKASIFTWTVENFSMLNDVYLQSENFIIGDVQWNLRLYPKGNGDGKVDKSISVFLAVADDDNLAENWEVNAEYKLRIRNQLNTSHHEKLAMGRYNHSLRVLGQPKLMPISDIIDKSKGFLKNDSLVLEVEFTKVEIIKNFK